MLLVEVRRDLVADEIDAEVGLEGDLRGRRQRTFQDRWQLVADRDVLPLARRGTLLAVVVLPELADLVERPFGQLDVAVLGRLLRPVALVADPRVLPHADLPIVLI